AADILIAGGAEQVRAVAGDAAVALPESRNVVDAVRQSVGKCEIRTAQIASVSNLLGHTHVHGVVIRLGDVREFRKPGEATGSAWIGTRSGIPEVINTSGIPGSQIQDAIGCPELERAYINERSQFMRAAADICEFEDCTRSELPLKAHIVLIGIGCAQVRIYDINSTAGIDRQVAGREEIEVFGRRLRGKWIRRDWIRVRERIAHVGRAARRQAGDRIKVQASRGKERRLTVELKVVFTF